LNKQSPLLHPHPLLLPLSKGENSAPLLHRRGLGEVEVPEGRRGTMG